MPKPEAYMTLIILITFKSLVKLLGTNKVVVVVVVIFSIICKEKSGNISKF